MVRVFIKGGVWKNSEDEILKAAVMKYGKQQWARVASLLNRKSAKQCKARWNEWLDPSVRKVEWSRGEDEKLLHLAKLLPAQWKTIGPLIGRTATQCQERYERLLDEAATAASGGDETEGGTTTASEVASAASATAATGPSAARKLRPGEIDPHPETRPARPDPIDMDEDEIEMLQEARARLANTQGKKAKRKQREKMLAEAKRLADLQKRRELKQAGLLSSVARTKLRKRSREIDLGVEIPFHKPAPAGFHDTTGEKMRSEAIRAKRLKDVDYKKLNEEQYRSRDSEALKEQKREEARLRALERANMQLSVSEVSKKNDPINARSRGLLKMPEPTVGDNELAEVAKLSQTMKSRGGIPSLNHSWGAGPSVTDALLGDYTDRPLPTPMRTPTTSARSSLLPRTETIMREAENLRMLERGQTPLLGGENPELHARTAGSVDSAHLPSNVLGEGMNVNATTPIMVPNGGVPRDALQRNTINQTPLSVRDELGLNNGSRAEKSGNGYSRYAENSSVVGDASTFAETLTMSGRSIQDIAREERRAIKLARRELALALASLPTPQFEYEIAVPEVSDDMLENEVKNSPSSHKKDAADVDAETIRKLKDDATKLYETRSSVLKRQGELPRPRDRIKFGTNEDSLTVGVILREMNKLIDSDAVQHPLVDHTSVLKTSKKKGSTKKNNKRRKELEGGAYQEFRNEAKSSPLDIIEQKSIDEARGFLSDETEKLLDEHRAASRCAYHNTQDNSVVDKRLMLFNVIESLEGCASEMHRCIVDYETEFDSIKCSSDMLRKKCDKMDAKLSIHNGGYAKRADGLRDGILQKYAELRHAWIEEIVYERLYKNELIAIEQRMASLKAEVTALAGVESSLQKHYGDLMHERNRLWKTHTQARLSRKTDSSDAR